MCRSDYRCVDQWFTLSFAKTKSTSSSAVTDKPARRAASRQKQENFKTIIDYSRWGEQPQISFIK